MNTFSYFILLCFSIVSCQTPQTASKSMYQHADTAMLSLAFETFKEPSLTNRRIKHRDIEPLILALKNKTDFQVQLLGQSVQKRNIYQIDYGTGDKRVMLWSQMHGDESTATMALFDLFNFLSAGHDDFDSIRSTIKNNTHLMFIPMLNPD